MYALPRDLFFLVVLLVVLAPRHLPLLRQRHVRFLVVLLEHPPLLRSFLYMVVSAYYLKRPRHLPLPRSRHLFFPLFLVLLLEHLPLLMERPRHLLRSFLYMVVSPYYLKRPRCLVRRPYFLDRKSVV